MRELLQPLAHDSRPNRDPSRNNTMTDARTTGNEKRSRFAVVQPRLLNLSTFINEHLREELTLELLASRINLSPFHFHRKFRAYFGESLHQHVKRLRLERSAQALLFQLAPVSVVARNSGYKTLSAFSHAFSAYFGIAPTRFRQDMLNSRLADVENGLRDRLGVGAESLEPAEIANLSARAVSFVRADVREGGELQSVCKALALVERGAHAEGAPHIALTTDLFGLLTGGGYRVEIGIDPASLEAGHSHEFGEVTLARGRYARFEYRGPAERVADVFRAAHLFWLPRSRERARSLAHFVLFDGSTANQADSVWQLYVPLEEAGAVAGEAGQS